MSNETKPDYSLKDGMVAIFNTINLVTTGETQLSYCYMVGGFKGDRCRLLMPTNFAMREMIKNDINNKINYPDFRNLLKRKDEFIYEFKQLLMNHLLNKFENVNNITLKYYVPLKEVETSFKYPPKQLKNLKEYINNIFEQKYTEDLYQESLDRYKEKYGIDVTEEEYTILNLISEDCYKDNAEYYEISFARGNQNTYLIPTKDFKETQNAISEYMKKFHKNSLLDALNSSSIWKNKKLSRVKIVQSFRGTTPEGIYSLFTID